MPAKQNIDIDAHKEDVFHIIPYFLRGFVPFSVLLIVAIAIYSQVEGWYEKKLIKSEQQQQVELSQQSLASDISSVIHELQYLAETIKPFTQSGGRVQREATENLLHNFARNIQRYDQIRWLNKDGIEVVRIDHRDGLTRIVPRDALQNKSSRYYFTESMKLPPGRIYISPLDLNVEHSEVEVPHRPMLRIATPTTDASGKRNGVLILNYQAARMLEDFSHSKHISSGELYLVDTNGHWLYASDDSPTWGFMFGNAKNFKSDFPDIWKSISNGREGSIESSKGIFSFIPIREAVFDNRPMPVRSEFGGEEYAALKRQRVKWIIVAFYPQGAMKGFFQNKFNTYRVLLFVGVLLLGVASWKRAREILERNNLVDKLALHAKVMETATNGVVITDTKPEIVAVNTAFTKVTGYSEEDVVGKNPSILSSGRHDKNFYDDMWQSLQLRGYWEGEIWNRHKSGEVFPEWMSISAVYDHENKLKNYIGIFSLLSEQQGIEERLRELANTDMLTGLINRGLFYDRVGQAMAYCRRADSEAAIMFLDLDGFKSINDTFGHAAGDTVLKLVAQRLTDHLRESDTISRFGGDEFVLLLTGIEDRDDLGALGEKIIDSVGQPITINGEKCHVGASIGICLYPADASSVDELLHCADQAMYRAKEEGKGRIAFYSCK